jgi:hypothetical protein
MNQRQAVKTIEGLREDVALSAAGDAIHIDIPPRGRHSRRRKKQRAAAAAVTAEETTNNDIDDDGNNTNIGLKL